MTLSKNDAPRSATWRWWLLAGLSVIAALIALSYSRGVPGLIVGEVPPADASSGSVVFVAKDDHGGGALMLVEDGQIRALTTGSDAIYLSVSSDAERGRVLAIALVGDMTTELQAIDVASAQAVTMATSEDGRVFTSVAVSPGGVAAVTELGPDGAMDLRLFDEAGRPTANVLGGDVEPTAYFGCSDPGPVGLQPLEWARGGEARLLVWTFREACEATFADLVAVTPAGDVTRISATGRADGGAWSSPDEDVLREQEDEIFAIPAGSSPPTDVEALERVSTGRELGVSPSGRRVATSQTDTSGDEVSYGIVARSHDGAGEALGRWQVPGRQTRLPAWQSDTEILFIASTPDSGAELFRITLGDVEAHQVTDLGLWITEFDPYQEEPR